MELKVDIEKIRKTGTTTVGMVAKDGVILAAESKSTMGWLVSSKHAKKVFQVDDRVGMTISGTVGDAQALIRILKAEISLYKLSRKSEMSLNAIANLVSNVLHSRRFYPYMAMFLIGGYDKTGPHLLSLDPIGGLEEGNYMATGSGSPMAYGVLEDGFKEGMKVQEAVELAARAIKSASERDVFSGGKDINIAVITEKGFEFVPREKIMKAVSRD